MKRGKLQRLSIAVAAAAMLLGGAAAKAISAEISASQFVGNMHDYVQNGDVTAAKDALQHLLDIGITQIKIGDTYYKVVDLMAMLNDPLTAKMLLAQLTEAVNGGIMAYFVTENRIVASVNWDDGGDGLFPTGSAG
jgi:hypothetical protein